jgi:hypothetical protein
MIDQMLKAFDDWLRNEAPCQTPGYWAMLAFAAGWAAREAQL